ncbi:hypothetical protein GCM10023205_43120 [Yinghuangia aomiensis]|uniref:DUF6891 domain-containing protein n=1 Tax=Yinghuangia aomiensis TaxID=676205 RepID=A0ABP9HK01_9ACTN
MVTDGRGDAIDRAFGELMRAGVVALRNAGVTQSDGWDEAEQRAETLSDELEDEELAYGDGESDEDPVRGAVFYHAQDLARARRGEGLYLTYGAFKRSGRSRADHDAASVEIGVLAREALARHGVDVEWNGSVDERLFLPPAAWAAATRRGVAGAGPGAQRRQASAPK